jgi:tRNA (guanine10-N2)-dimethyltransferase
MNLYFLKHTVDETELCNLEKRCLFKVINSQNYFIVENYIDVSRSPFVKYCIKDILFSDSLENLVKLIGEKDITYDNFKVKYLDIDKQTDFNRRHEIESIIGYVIKGLARVEAPSVTLGVTCLEGKWMLGEYLKNEGVWREHNNRPQEYCNALTTRVSRAVVNITAGESTNSTIIDPCCGIGTVVMEAISMGFDIVGYDINENISNGAKRNLDFFGYPEVVKQGDIHNLKGHYDIAIIDLPYGILSFINRSEQLDIVKSAKKLAHKIAVISAYDAGEDFKSLNLEVIDMCIIPKGKFKRYLNICIKKTE